jgi:excisionase family DNA binding protein
MAPSTPAPLPRLRSVAQAADHLDSTTSKLHELVARHALPSVRIGRAIRIPRDAVSRLASRPARAETEVRPFNLARTDRLESDPRELARLDHAADRISNGAPHRRLTSDAGPKAARCHREQQTSEPRQPDSREAANPDTDLHPCATGRRVDAESTREARS